MASARLLKFFGVLAIGMLHASPSEGLETWRFKEDQVAFNNETSVSLREAFEKLNLEMSFSQVVAIIGEPLSKIPEVNKVALWRKKDFRVDLILEKDAISSKNYVGLFPMSINELETYEEVVKVLGPPDKESETLTFSWRDQQACGMIATFLGDQAISIQFYCRDGKFGMKSGPMENIEF